MHDDTITPRNHPIGFIPAWIDNISINAHAIDRRVAELPTRRSVKKVHQAAWLLKTISCMDLTTLSGDDTDRRVMRLAAKARKPISNELTRALGIESLNLTVGGLCIYHDMIPAAKRGLGDANIPIVVVSTGFPAGLSPFHSRLQEIRESVVLGATEIDIVISRRLVLEGKWQELYDELVQMREAVGDVHIKAILATGELGRMTNVAKASMVAMMAGVDFVKTSTGKESTNATLGVSLVMIRMIREYYERTGIKVGYKPAGGISKAKDAINYLIMIKEELGDEWLRPELFRFGASSLLGDVERQLDHYVTGGYSVNYRHALA